jgi:hypothetical protein
MTKYEIANRIRGLLDFDFDDVIDATLDLAEEIERYADAEKASMMTTIIDRLNNKQ